MAEKSFLDGAYTVADAGATRALYRDWAATYERELRENGYATPRRCALALAEAAADRSAPVLDVGCGTGLSGEALREAGFTTVDGTDFSPEMLDAARGKPGIYRALVQGDLNDPLPAAPGDYAHVTAVGVFSPGHAPAGLIDAVMAILPAGGCFVFSLNDHALADPAYEGAIDRLLSRGEAEVVLEEYGDHLPGHGLRARVYVLRRS